MLDAYIAHQKDVIIRRTKFELNKAEKRVHILEGYKIALDNIDAVIQTIRSSATADIARTSLMENFKLSQRQAQAILDMRLQRLTGLERKKIEDEYMPIGLAMFSLDGQCKADMRLSGATMINDSTIDSNGECLALAQTGAGTTFYRFSSEGNPETNWSLRGEYYSINKILGLPNGEVLLADETKVEKFNDAGESLGTFDLGVIGGKTVMAGDTVYVQTAVNEQTGEEHLCYIQELDTTQLTLKGEKKKVNADALLFPMGQVIFPI